MPLIRYVQGKTSLSAVSSAFEDGDIGCRERRTRSRKASLGPDQREQPDEDGEEARRCEREGEWRSREKRRRED